MKNEHQCSQDAEDNTDSTLAREMHVAFPTAGDDAEYQLLREDVLYRIFGNTEDDSDSLGQQFGHYRILNRIGRGAMGIVFAAHDCRLDRTVALKFLQHPGAFGPNLHGRLVREAKAMARLAHPNIVAVHEVGLVDGKVYLAMEWIPGQTLRTWLRAGRSWREIVRVFAEAATGLAAAHEAGLVHRDFKPDNVLVGDDGRPRIADFGLARTISAAKEPMSPKQRRGNLVDPPTHSALTATGFLVGTPAYMSPEVYAGLPADAKSDQFSFCISLWEAIYGERPFCGESIPDLSDSITHGRIRKPPFKKRALHQSLHRILLRGLTTNPDDRFSTMTELAQALDDELRASSHSTPVLLCALSIYFAITLYIGISFIDSLDLIEILVGVSIALGVGFPISVAMIIGAPFSLFFETQHRQRFNSRLIRSLYLNPVWILAFAGTLVYACNGAAQDSSSLVLAWLLVPVFAALCRTTRGHGLSSHRRFVISAHSILAGYLGAAGFILVQILLRAFTPSYTIEIRDASLIAVIVALFGTIVAWRTAHPRSGFVAPGRWLAWTRLSFAPALALAALLLYGVDSLMPLDRGSISASYEAPSQEDLEACVCDGCVAGRFSLARDDRVRMIFQYEGSSFATVTVHSDYNAKIVAPNLFQSSSEIKENIVGTGDSVHVEIRKSEPRNISAERYCIALRAHSIPSAKHVNVLNVGKQAFTSQLVHIGDNRWQAYIRGTAAIGVAEVILSPTWKFRTEDTLPFKKIVLPTQVHVNGPEALRHLNTPVLIPIQVESDGHWEAFLEFTSDQTNAAESQLVEMVISAQSRADFIENSNNEDARLW